jgi:uncharacterized protein (TIGR00730 family)
MSKKPPHPHRDPGEHELPCVPVIKAYRNDDFLNSSHARHIRILCEYEETMQRLRAANVRASVMFFGSARSKDHTMHARAVSREKAKLDAAPKGSADATAAEQKLKFLASIEWMCDYMDKIRELSRRVTQWSVNRAAKPLDVVSGVARVARHKRLRAERKDGEQSDSDTGEAASYGLARQGSMSKFKYQPHSSDADLPAEGSSSMAGAVAEPRHLPVYVCTGGGPGFMEAANRGAADVKGGKSIGMGITLPFETGLNPYVTPELAFEYHYFFTRKFWMAFHMQALVVAPGGFGTMDELFELLTLKQVGKMQRSLPVVLFGKEYWKSIINWEVIGKYGVINPAEVDELLFTDDVDEAFNFIIQALEGGVASWTDGRGDGEAETTVS